MSTSSFFTPLSDLAVIEISGADAASFLHGQLSHDMSSLAPGQARLAGYCTAKGRLLGSMVVWSVISAEVPVLRALIKADIAESIVKRLSMFVLRAKAKLSVTPIQVLGLSLDHSPGEPAEAAPIQADTMLAEQAAKLPGNPLPFTVVHTDAGDWIAAPRADGAAVRWWLAAANTLNPDGWPDAANTRWQAADIAAGLPWVQTATQEVFIPQTLNLDLIDGVSFTKGCYPGQEVVARSHYRGTVKRRMAYGLIQNATDIDAIALPGTDTFDDRHPENPAGRVINAAQTPAQVGTSVDMELIHILMEVQLTDLPEAQFRLGSASGPVIKIQPLPYSIEAS
ncbi:YgfZ/GcvT domain-containing protein [Pollutimonas harenae]|uniref:Folate-binding protein YgfZ n=1 Tax=Pollutimonas harenae TaxID=657015 RepID=A0A853GUU0_9BURK|nr:folate-binding protein YgfZ [Pollutimonas harenae]NYT86051.1 folate-binding protein YgfZ [Pollutimonas harenae]TEA71099.1 folate-binding protein [Pollutimonas harenae]